VKTSTNKRFESMYTLQGKTRPTRHPLSTLSLCMTLDHTYLTWSTYSNLSRVINSAGRILLLLRKKCSRLHLSARLSGPWDPPQFLSQHSYEAVGLSQASVDGRLLSLLGTYHYHAIDTFNTCSWGPTHRS
jgi:hypothetical protein